MKRTQPDNTVQPRHCDIAGQLDMNGNYAKPPDKACKIDAAPLAAPKRKASPKVKAKRRIFNLGFVRNEPVRMPENQFTEIDE